MGFCCFTVRSHVKPIANGPSGLIAALSAALGPEGTLVMPSMTEDDDHPFDPRQTPCTGMGVVAQTFWQQPAVMRSDSPHAFAASGPQANHITAPHPVDLPHGLNSPVGRVYELDGQVLLLGVGHDSIPPSTWLSIWQGALPAQKACHAAERRKIPPFRIC